MDFKPRHPQPFTIQQAIGFDVSVIDQEIARLQNSIAHLGETQSLLREHLSSEGHDAELAVALDENETVIASQQERISMLQFVLREKGVISTSHYALPSNSPPAPFTPPSLQADETTSEHGGLDL
ncbi:hypothetical protein AX14_004221 [Amanita brunnescens Koide BX004]|nr:hypothetical protein AX14_004221 [Amanita brunnescens Koide BX004]